jgi:hypothetical protein
MKREEFGNWGKSLSEQDFWCAVAILGALQVEVDLESLVDTPQSIFNRESRGATWSVLLECGLQVRERSARGDSSTDSLSSSSKIIPRSSSTSEAAKRGCSGGRKRFFDFTNL